MCMEKYTIIFSDNHGNKLVKKIEWSGSKKSIMIHFGSLFHIEAEQNLRGEYDLKIVKLTWKH